MVLYINACVREGSRTKRLADHLISMLKDQVREVQVWEIAFPIADDHFLQQRDSLIAKADYSSGMFDLAKEFAAAELIVIAAPFWDLSFPAALKQYFEQINVTGITFTYTDEGIPRGLCRAEKLYYVTTSGGPIISDEYGYGYVKALAQGFYGIPQTEMWKAEGLDIVGADVEGILREAEARIESSLMGISDHSGDAAAP